MKKILSVILVAIILVSCMTFSASAFEEPTPPFEWNFVEDEETVAKVRASFKEHLFKEYPFLSSRDEAFPEDEMYVQVICTQDEATVFHGNFGASADVETTQLIGQYVFFGGALDGPEFENPIGLYAMKNDGSTINLIDAYEEGLVDIDDVAAHYPWNTKIPDREFDVVTKLGLVNKAAFGTYYHYEELFLITTEEVGDKPAFVLIEAAEGTIHDGDYIERIGDYVVSTRTNFLGNALPYYVYLSNGELLTLKEAMEREIPILMEAVLDSDIPTALSGDADSDGKLTVKDATYVQKKVADFHLDPVYSYQMEEVVLDFDGDKKITVKDATAIQKKIAGLEEKPATPDEITPTPDDTVPTPDEGTTNPEDSGLTGDLLGAANALRYYLDTYQGVPAPGGTYPSEDVRTLNAEREASEKLLERGDFTMEEILRQTDALVDALEKFVEVDILMEVD